MQVCAVATCPRCMGFLEEASLVLAVLSLLMFGRLEISSEAAAESESIQKAPKA